MLGVLVLWSHSLAALAFALLAGWTARRPNAGLPRGPLAAALAFAALWALAVAGVGTGDAATRLAETLRTLALLALMIAMFRARCVAPPLGLATVYGVVVAVACISLVLQLRGLEVPQTDAVRAVAATAQLFAMLVAVAALVLVQHLHVTGPSAPERLVIAALALVWLGDLNLATGAYLIGAAPPQLMLLRGGMALAAAVLLAAALARRTGEVKVSRTVAYQSLSLVAVGGYFGLLALVTSALGAIGGAHARVLQTAFVFGSTAALLTLVSSGWLRAWIKVKIAKHLFAHRYDYRVEWLRFSGTLGAPGGAPLDERVVKAVADLTDSPAGLLLVPEAGGLGLGAAWNWPGHVAPAHAGSAALAAHLASTGRIMELDVLRSPEGIPAEVALAPQWLLDRADAWAVVPLLHLDTLIGAIVLARPVIDRALDWEDFDLLRVAGRQVASHLAEAGARDALAEAQRFDEFNRRFAFIVHDIKNLVSGLTLVARNAERHADNPAFRADMVATLQDSAAKLSGLLTRLSHQPRAHHGPAAPVELGAIVERVAAARRSVHPVVVQAAPGAMGLADAGALEQLLGHLVQNAVEASPSAEPVTVGIEQRHDAVVITVADRGCGMSPAFVRDQLFRPFASSKAGGFGIGAYEARQLAEGFGARIEVDSREGEGSSFHVILAPAIPLMLERAA